MIDSKFAAIRAIAPIAAIAAYCGFSVHPWVDEFFVDPSIEAIREAVDRVDEEADEIIVEEIIINSITEAIIDKIARGEAVLDKIARGEAARDKTAEEGKAILVAAERIDEEVKGPRFESSPQ